MATDDVDLAGSERQNDSSQHSAKLMQESASINTSLLALKHAIRAVSQRQQQRRLDKQLRRKKTSLVMSKARKELGPVFRGAKLTMVLRDSFIHPRCLVHILCTVNLTASSSHHTLETLRMTSQLLGRDHDDIVTMGEQGEEKEEKAKLNNEVGTTVERDGSVFVDRSQEKQANSVKYYANAQEVRAPPSGRAPSVARTFKKNSSELPERSVFHASPRKSRFLSLLKKKQRRQKTHQEKPKQKRRPVQLNLAHLSGGTIDADAPPAPSSPFFNGLSPMAYQAAAASSRRRGSRVFEDGSTRSDRTNQLPPPPPGQAPPPRDNKSFNFLCAEA